MRKTSLLLAAILVGCVAKGSGGSDDRPSSVNNTDGGSAGAVAAGGDTGASGVAGSSGSDSAGSAGSAGTSGSNDAGSNDAGSNGATAGDAGTGGSAGDAQSGSSGDTGTAGTSGGAGASGTSGGAGAGGASGGAGASGASGSAGTGPDPTKLLTALTADEQTAMCQEIDDYLNTPDVLSKQHEMDCRSAGFYSTVGSMPTDQATARMMCQMTHDLCLASEGPSSVMNCGVVGSSCTATVGDLLACWHSQSDELTLALATIPSCDALTLADLQMTMRPSPPPSAECQSFDQKCPGVMMMMALRK